jgi:low temperature requirement protein LtrA
VAGVLFACSGLVHTPWRYLLWAAALVLEAGLLLVGERRERRRQRKEALERGAGRAEMFRAMFSPPTREGVAVDAAHVAERFGLFIIILLGEIVISVGAAALDRPRQDTGYWLVLCGGLVLGGALWWIYFDSAAEINERLLSASGGNPSLAYSLYAGGHLGPAYALLVVAAGVSLSLHEEPPAAAPWLLTAGLAGYVAGTRVFNAAGRPRPLATLLRLLALAATVLLALLERVVGAPVVVVVVACWAVLAACAVSVLRRAAGHRLGEDPFGFLKA